MFRPFIEQARNSVTLFIKRNAGHSKWQNIRHIKALKDGQRSLLFTKLGHKIKIAIQENGNNSNPDSNFQLAQVIEIAKKNSMPALTIQSFLKNSLASKDKDNAKSHWLTVKGRRSSMFLISILTTNINKTKGEIACILKKNGAQFDEGAKGVFEHKGIIVAVPPNDTANPTELAVDHAIEAGAEEVQPVETTDNTFLFQFVCDAYQFFKAKAKLLELKYTIKESDLIYVPRMTTSLTDDEMEAASTLIEKLERLPDVVCVYDNIQ